MFQINKSKYIYKCSKCGKIGFKTMFMLEDADNKKFIYVHAECLMKAILESQ